MIKVSAPGKLFLSGEWAVLEMGNPGLVAAVDKRVYAEIEEQQHLSYNPYISITVDDFNIRNVRASFDGDRLNYVDEIADEEKNRLIFIKGAIETALKYIQKCMPFRIRSWGEMSQIKLETGEAKKIGFGSSAAAVVATVAAILAFHGMDIEKRHTKDIIYKLSAMAHYFAQGKVGSAFDVAASTYGGVFVYKRFDPLWLVERMEKKEDVKNIAESEWPGFHVEELDIPEGFSLAIAWTKEEASTSAMIKQMDNFKKENPEEYKKVYNDIGKLVSEIIARWKKNEKERII
ncbi:MAG: phosphomevalonate kinase, partial [Candidatus Aenigmarchaeota archaeon]|nr:phosphomevalonate kinase [Candidatus Aenigmarchaeota archaeon]